MKQFFFLFIFSSIFYCFILYHMIISKLLCFKQIIHLQTNSCNSKKENQGHDKRSSNIFFEIYEYVPLITDIQRIYIPSTIKWQSRLRQLNILWIACLQQSFLVFKLLLGDWNFYHKRLKAEKHNGTWCKVVKLILLSMGINLYILNRE